MSPARLGPIRLIALMAALAAALASSALAASPTPQTTLSDIEDEVMCTICGTTLAVSNAPSADRQRAFINELIAAGRSKQEIKDALVDEYGPEVLAVPDSRGFDLVGGWILPAGAVLLAAILVIATALRWRRDRADEADLTEADAEVPASAEQERLQRDLDRYD